MSFRIRVSALGTLLLALSAPAFAQTSQNAMVAEALFEDGQKLMTAGKTAEACEKFAASQKLDPALGTLLNLAACHEKLGKTATAWFEFNEAFSQATKQGDKTRAQFARSHVDALEKQLYRLTITVQKANRNLSVKLDGSEIAREVYGTAIPLDPGEHQLEATQAGRKPFRKTLNGGPGTSDTVDVPELPEMEYGMPHPDQPDQQPDNNPPPPPKEEPKKGGANIMLIAGISTLGAGAVGIGVGAIFGIMALGEASERDKLCMPKTVCRNQAAFDHDYNAHVDQTMMFIIGGAGAALAITGGVLLGLGLTQKKPAVQTTTGWVVSPAVGPHLTGIQVGGAF